MGHKNIYSRFKDLFPEKEQEVELWFPNGKNTIRLRMQDKREFIFNYTSDLDWNIQTVSMFLKGEKNGKKSNQL